MPCGQMNSSMSNVFELVTESSLDMRFSTTSICIDNRYEQSSRQG